MMPSVQAYAARSELRSLISDYLHCLASNSYFVTQLAVNKVNSKVSQPRMILISDQT
jgi:hypothetical protein